MMPAKTKILVLIDCPLSSVAALKWVPRSISRRRWRCPRARTSLSTSPLFAGALRKQNGHGKRSLKEERPRQPLSAPGCGRRSRRGGRLWRVPRRCRRRRRRRCKRPRDDFGAGAAAGRGRRGEGRRGLKGEQRGGHVDRAGRPLHLRASAAAGAGGRRGGGLRGSVEEAFGVEGGARHRLGEHRQRQRRQLQQRRGVGDPRHFGGPEQPAPAAVGGGRGHSGSGD